MSKTSNKYDFLYRIPDNIKNDEYHHNDNIVKCVGSIVKKMRIYDEILCCAEMQSGKTDVIKRLIYVIRKYNDRMKELDIFIDCQKIYLIICTSSLNLKNQLQHKLPEIEYHIYHLNDIYKFLKNPLNFHLLLMNMCNSGLVIFDECHCDIEKNKLIDKFRSLLQQISRMYDSKFYKLCLSATPYEQIIANYPKVILTPGEDYYGIQQMFEIIESPNAIPVIFQAKKLEDEIECDEFFNEIELHNYFYIFRLPSIKEISDKIMNNLEKGFRKRNCKIDTYIYDMSYQEDINDLLIIRPNKTTIIYVKDKLRIGEYLNTQYVYLVHDDPTNMYTHTTVQSLLGRCCGYNKRVHNTIIYCDYQKAYQHYIWVKNKYDMNHIPSNAKYIKKDGSGTKNKCIY